MAEEARPFIPEKDFFNIGEACRIVQLPPHTLRYWEKRAALVRPSRRESGHRRYTRSDLETLLRVKALVTAGMTVAGARKAMSGARRKAGTAAGPSPTAVRLLREVRDDLRRMMEELR